MSKPLMDRAAQTLTAKLTAKGAKRGDRMHGVPNTKRQAKRR